MLVVLSMLILKQEKEIEVMAEGGRRLAEVVDELIKSVRVGVATKELDKLAAKLIRGAGAEPAFLNYRPPGALKTYPFTLCASVNSTVVHGQPSAYELKDGDLVKLDLGLKYKGFYADMAVTVGVGKIGRGAQKLMETTERALAAAIVEAKPGRTLGDIGYVIERTVAKGGFSVAEQLTGHGIGRNLHEDPTVFNFGDKGMGEELRPGMVLAIEPMVCMGSGRVKEVKDGSFVTADDSLAAHFEHTVAITREGPRILTVL